MSKVLKIEPNTKDGLLKTISKALENARKGNIEQFLISWKTKDDEQGEHYFNGNGPELNIMIDVLKANLINTFVNDNAENL